MEINSLQRKEEIWKTSPYSWLSVTIDQIKKPSASVILCHGLTGDKVGPQKLLSDLSLHLVKTSNIEIIRFDFRGSGLSSGSFEQTSLGSMIEDALMVAKRQTLPIIWMGISTGALVALIAAATRDKNEKVIAISNGFTQNPNFTDLNEDPIPLREGQLYLSKNYFLQRSAIRPKDYFAKVRDLRVILGSNDPKHYGEHQKLRDANIEVHLIKEGDHLFTNPEKRKELFIFIEELLNETK